MPFTLDSFKEQLDYHLSRFDKQAVAADCKELIAYLYDPREKIDPVKLERILQALRNKRMFALMQKLADCFMELGYRTPKIRRQYAQSLIDQNIYGAPLAILQDIDKEITTDDAASKPFAEKAEAIGLIGRIFKQQYVNARQPLHPRMIALLNEAIKNYNTVYRKDPDQFGWHGINVVALLHRADRDRIRLEEYLDHEAMAKAILKHVEDLETDHLAMGFDYATALEACIALDKPDDAMKWLGKYLNNSSAEAFELNSTLRQLQEVWELTPKSAVGEKILPVLNAALLDRLGATLTFDKADLSKQRLPDADMKNLERVLGNTSFSTYQWYLNGVKACSAVVRIGEDTDNGLGSGFLLAGSLLSPALGDDLVLVTNAHVVSDDLVINRGALKPDRAVATLETVDGKPKLGFSRIIRTSSRNELDFTVLEFDAPSREKLRAIRQNIVTYRLADDLPDPNDHKRVYIIGYPGGGGLQLSLQDNVFLACNDKFIQYRTPTEHGSSGSPVFNDRWELIGLHHAGSDKMPRLDDPTKKYEANEGIWINAIKKQFA
jgi:V8-like Glu-specific endopeptidase